MGNKMSVKSIKTKMDTIFSHRMNTTIILITSVYLYSVNFNDKSITVINNNNRYE